MLIFEFGIKVTSGTMPNFLFENRFLLLLNLGILGHKKSNKTAIKEVNCHFFFFFVNSFRSSSP